MTTATDYSQEPLLALTTQITTAYLSRNTIEAGALPNLIREVHKAVTGIAGSTAPTEAEQKTAQTPAVPIRKSVFPDYIVCLEDGKQMTMLKRHLSTAYKMTPDQYRAKWGLPPGYPMVAPNYAETRSKLAKEMGLGKNRFSKAVVKAATTRKPRTSRRATQANTAAPSA